MLLAAGHAGPQTHYAAGGPAAGAGGFASRLRRPPAAGRASAAGAVASQQQTHGAAGVQQGADECAVQGEATQPWTWLQRHLPGRATWTVCIYGGNVWYPENNGEKKLSV